MDVLDVVGRVVACDVDTADLSTVRERLADAGRVRAWFDAWEITAMRRLDDLAQSGSAVFPEHDLATHGNTSRRAAENVGRRKRALDALPQLTDRLSNGDVSGEHLDALHRGLAPLNPDDRRSFLDTHGQRLADLATRTTPDLFARRVKEAAAKAQSDGGIANLEKQKRAIRLKTWTDQITGMLRISGEFDPESGLKIVGRLRALVEELFHGSTPDNCPTDPSAKQDYLCALALIALVEGNTSAAEAGAGRPDIIVVVDEQTLRRGLHDHSIIDLGDPDTFLPIETLRRMACLANIIPAVLDSNGVLRDLGRGSRLATPAQRRAMRAMYPSCGVHGCRVPFERCVIHHIRYWENGGTSDMANMIPLCSRHHHAAHEGGWLLHLHPTTRVLTVTYPDGSVEAHAPPRARAG